MIDIKEDKSLAEVRQWKEAVYRDTKNLTPADFLLQIQRNNVGLKAKYDVKLRKISAALQI